MLEKQLLQMVQLYAMIVILERMEKVHHVGLAHRDISGMKMIQQRVVYTVRKVQTLRIDQMLYSVHHVHLVGMVLVKVCVLDVKKEHFKTLQEKVHVKHVRMELQTKLNQHVINVPKENEDGI